MLHRSYDSEIARVETGLSSIVRITGRPVNHWSLADRMSHYRVPGVSVAVAEEGDLRWAKGYGVKVAGGTDPVTSETIFQAASISKPVSAMGALQLVEEGLIGLDEDVNRFLRNWKIPENDTSRQAPVTLRGLLSHTAGLTVHGFEGYAAGQPLPSIGQVLDGKPPANSAAVRVENLPGSQMSYSGGGYTVLQQLIEDITGQPFPRVMRERVLDPLGMVSSAFAHPLPARDALLAAHAHHGDGSPYPGGWHTYPELAAAGLWTTPSDLARFAQEVQEAFVGRGVVISGEMAQKFLEPQLGPLTPGANAMERGGNGLGLFLSECQGTLFFEHSGSNAGYRCELLASIEGGRCVVVMTNGDNGDLLRSEIMMSIGGALGWPELSAIEKEEAALDGNLLRQAPGQYEIEPGVSIEIMAREGDLYVRMGDDGAPLLRMHASNHREVFLTELPISIQFSSEADGQITGLEISGMQARKITPD